MALILTLILTLALALALDLDLGLDLDLTLAPPGARGWVRRGGAAGLPQAETLRKPQGR